MLKITISLFFITFAGMLNAANITTQADTYKTGEPITAVVTNVNGGNNNWVGIYPAAANNDWANVIKWSWANGSQVNLAGVPNEGNYEVRFFYNNSFNLDSSHAFAVTASTSVETQKTLYKANESIIVSLSNMAGNNNDWVGIYPAGSNNDWANVVRWSWTDGLTNGNLTLNGIPTLGEYEVRVFFNNTYNVEASYAFSIADNATISTNKNNYNSNGETITVTLSNMLGDDEDWVGVYPVGTNNDWANVISWSWTDGIHNGNVDLAGITTVGNYEVRAFFKNSFNSEAVASFTVTDAISELWKKGPYDVAPILELPAENAVVFSPQGIDEQALPVVFFVYGGSANQYLLKHHTLLNFIASHGYHAVFITNVSTGSPAWTAGNYIAAVESLKNHRNVNTAKVGIIGHSSGGGAAFGILKELMKAPNNYGSDKSFLLAIDPWFAYEMNKQDLMALPVNTNTVILQFGIGGNNMEIHPAYNFSFATDALIPLTLYKYLNASYPNNVDYHIFEDAGNANRGHLYLYDNFVENGESGNNYASMKGGLNPLGALMELTFNNGNDAIKAIALGQNQSNAQVIKPIEEYTNFKCHSNAFGVSTDINGRLIEPNTQNYLTDIEYCNEVPRN